MGHDSAKKITKANDKFIRNCLIALGCVWLVYVAYRVGWLWPLKIWGWLEVVFFAGLNGYIISVLYKISRPRTDETGKMFAGADLTEKGLIEYHWDILYLSWASMLVTMFTVWGWIIMALVPGYALFKFCTMERPDFGGGGEETRASQRKKERQEKKNKTKVVTVRR